MLHPSAATQIWPETVELFGRTLELLVPEEFHIWLEVELASVSFLGSHSYW